MKGEDRERLREIATFLETSAKAPYCEDAHHEQALFVRSLADSPAAADPALLVEALEHLIVRVDRDLHEPDKLLCHLAPARRALLAFKENYEKKGSE